MGLLAQKKELDDMKKTLQTLHDKYADIIKTNLSGTQTSPSDDDDVEIIKNVMSTNKVRFCDASADNEWQDVSLTSNYNELNYLVRRGNKLRIVFSLYTNATYNLQANHRYQITIPCTAEFWQKLKSIAESDMSLRENTSLTPIARGRFAIKESDYTIASNTDVDLSWNSTTARNINCHCVANGDGRVASIYLEYDIDLNMIL